MATLRQKWAIHRTYRRIQNCWQEYIAVSDKDDVQLMVQKLEDFLDTFQNAYKEWSACGITSDVALDKLYGDCTEVLVTKKKPDIELDRVADLINKGLNVSELILKDEKYQQVVANTPNLICRILLLLEKLNTTEAKKLALRVISTLGESDLNKLEIGRHEGFKKILQLLLDGEIVVDHGNKNVNKFGSSANGNEEESANAFFNSIIGSKVSTVVSKVREILTSELGQVFPNFNVVTNNILDNKDLNFTSKINRQGKRTLSYIPTSDQIEKIILRFDNIDYKDIDQLDNIDIANNFDTNNIIYSNNSSSIDNNGDDDINGSAASTPDLSQDNHDLLLMKTSNIINYCNQNEFSKALNPGIVSPESKNTNSNSDMLKEFMRVQGALRSLTNILSETTSQPAITSTLRFDIVETICKLLFLNSTNQVEFRKMNGYSILLRILDDDDSISGIDMVDRGYFLKDCFSVFFTLSIDGNKDMIVNNIDVFKLIFRAAASSSQLDVRQSAIKCIQDLISLNCLNAFVGWKIGGVDILINVLDSALQTSGNIDEVSQALKLGEILLKSNNKTFSDEYTRILMKNSLLPAKNIIVNIILHSVSRLFTDLLSRGKFVDNNFLDNYLQLLRELYQQTPSNYESLMTKKKNDEFFIINSPLHNTNNNHSLERVIIAEQYLLILQNIGLLVDATGRNMELFESLQGFETLHNAIVLSSACQPGLDEDIMVADMALWLLREYIVCCVDCIESWLIRILKYMIVDNQNSDLTSFNSTKTNSSFESISSVLNKSDRAKKLFGEFGGLEVLISIIKHSTNSNVASAAFQTVGNFFSSHVDAQLLRANSFSYDGFLELVLSSTIPIDKAFCEIFLEVATDGSVLRPLSPSIAKTDNFLISSDIMPFITNLLKPVPLFTNLLPFTQKRQISFNKKMVSCRNQGHKRNNSRATINSMSSLVNNSSIYEGSTLNGSFVSLNNTIFMTNENDLTTTNDSSLAINSSCNNSNKPNGLNTNNCSHDRLDSPTMSIRSNMQLPSPTLSPVRRVNQIKSEEIMLEKKDKQPTTRKRSNSRNLGGFSLSSNQTIGSGSSRSSSNGTNVTEEVKEKLVNGTDIVFRDIDAAFMSLKILAHITDKCDETLQRYYFNLIMSLMEVNPRNKEFLCANHAYDITNHDVTLLFDAAYDPLSMLKQFLAKGFFKIDYDPFFLREVQSQMIYAIERISERMDPSCYFNFNGFDSSLQTIPMDKFPNVKNGYTLSLWVKVTAFLENEIGLLCYEDLTGANTTFELYFKKIDQPYRYCLCVKTQQFPLPPEDFVFDGFSFQQTLVWHHIVFVHSKDGTSLIVDGSSMQSYDMFNSPKAMGKEKIVAVVGRRGLWDETIAEKVFNQGPAYSKNYRVLGIENKEFISVHPQSYLSIEQKLILEPEKSRRNSDSIDFTKITGKLEGGCTVHVTRSMRDIIEQFGKVEQCFRFLELDSRHQLIGLRTISNLLYKSPQNMAKFTENNGFSTLRKLLGNSNNNELSIEHFNVLMDIASDGITRNDQMVIVNTECLRVIVELLGSCCKEDVQLPVIRMLVDMLVEVPNNLKIWRTNLGVETLLELLDNLSCSLEPFIMRVIESMMSEITTEELNKLFNYIECGDGKWVNLDIKYDIVEIIYKNMTHDSQLVERIRVLKGISLLTPLLEAPNEKFCIIILKMIGILMSSNIKHSKALLTRVNNGFDVMFSYLAGHELSLEFTQVLIGVGTNYYQNDPKFKNDELIYPEMVRLLFDLIKLSRNSELVFQALTDVKRLLTPINMRILWEQNWLEWIIGFVSVRSGMTVTEGTTHYRHQSILTIIDTIVQKMMIFDISRKNSITSKTKGALLVSSSSSNNSYYENFTLRIMDITISYFDKNPNVNVSTNTSNIIFRNLGILYKYLDEHISIASLPNFMVRSSSSTNLHNVISNQQLEQQVIITATSVRRHFASTINILAYHNNSTIRTSMKSSGLFKIRDNLIKDYNDLAPIDGNEFI
ncbi:8442_t:CDS:10 [Entrophospora sp. SA101]|nr:8442_t:CDS:10 [Entrophospora sp. SA101]